MNSDHKCPIGSSQNQSSLQKKSGCFLISTLGRFKIWAKLVCISVVMKFREEFLIAIRTRIWLERYFVIYSHYPPKAGGGMGLSALSFS